MITVPCTCRHCALYLQVWWVVFVGLVPIDCICRHLALAKFIIGYYLYNFAAYAHHPWHKGNKLRYCCKLVSFFESPQSCCFVKHLPHFKSLPVFLSARFFQIGLSNKLETLPISLQAVSFAHRLHGKIRPSGDRNLRHFFMQQLEMIYDMTSRATA